MDRRKDSMKWIVGMVVAGALGISGWMFGGLQNANAQTHSQLYERMDASDKMTRDFMNEVRDYISSDKVDKKYIKDALRQLTGAE